MIFLQPFKVLLCLLRTISLSAVLSNMVFALPRLHFSNHLQTILCLITHIGVEALKNNFFFYLSS